MDGVGINLRLGCLTDFCLNCFEYRKHGVYAVGTNAVYGESLRANRYGKPPATFGQKWPHPDGVNIVLPQPPKPIPRIRPHRSILIHYFF